jgi:hypothetical protein
MSTNFIVTVLLLVLVIVVGAIYFREPKKKPQDNGQWLMELIEESNRLRREKQ